MTPGMIIGALVAVGAIVFISYLFVRDHRIRSRGRLIRARIDDVVRVATSETGAVTVKYRLSWREDGAPRQVQGRETISARNAARMLVGAEIDIVYLDDDHVLFEFGPEAAAGE